MFAFLALQCGLQNLSFQKQFGVCSWLIEPVLLKVFASFLLSFQPLQRLRDELKSYVQRHTLVELEEPVKQMFDSYNILQRSEQLQVSETCSHVPKDGSRSSDDDVRSSSSVANTERLQPKVLNKETTETKQVKVPTKEKSSNIGSSTPRTRNSVNRIAATAKSASQKAGGRVTKQKLQKPVKPEPKKDKVKRQGKKSAQGGEGSYECTLFKNHLAV